MSLTSYSRPTDLFDLLTYWDNHFFPVTRHLNVFPKSTIKVDMKETENDFVVCADIPGVIHSYKK